MSPSAWARAILSSAALLAGLSLTLAACDEAPRRIYEIDDASPPGITPTGEGVQVIRAIDGDTIDVRTEDGRRRRVRLLGIDSPESTTLRTGRTECGGQEATAAMKALVARNPDLLLQTDAGQDAEDQYGRILAYLTPPNGGPTLQEQMLSAGWAKVYDQRGEPIERDAAFRAAAERARRAQVGVWQLCGGNFRKPR